MNNDSNSKEDRLRALIALSATKPLEEGQCPSDNEIAAYIEGKLDRDNREKISRHLQDCDICRGIYNFTKDLEEEESEPAPFPAPKNKKVVPFPKRQLRKMTVTLNAKTPEKHKIKIVSGIMALAASLILALVFSLNHRSDISTIITAQYEFAKQNNIRQSDSDFYDTLLNSKPGTIRENYGFVQTESSESTNAHSFIVGLDNGLKILNTLSSLQEKPDSNITNDYYWIGRWYALLCTVCSSENEIPERFWTSQQKIIDSFQAQFLPRKKEENEAIILERSLERMTSIIKKQTADKQRGCNLIHSELKMIIESF